MPRQQKSQQSDKPPRPLNSFFLFRAEISERCKETGLNPRIISSVAGMCWRKCPPHIQEYYKRIAKKNMDEYKAKYGAAAMKAAAKNRGAASSSSRTTGPSIYDVTGKLHDWPGVFSGDDQASAFDKWNPRPQSPAMVDIDDNFDHEVDLPFPPSAVSSIAVRRVHILMKLLPQADLQQFAIALKQTFGDAPFRTVAPADLHTFPATTNARASGKETDVTLTDEEWAAAWGLATPAEIQQCFYFILNRSAA